MVNLCVLQDLISTWAFMSNGTGIESLALNAGVRKPLTYCGPPTNYVSSDYIYWEWTGSAASANYSEACRAGNKQPGAQYYGSWRLNAATTGWLQLDTYGQDQLFVVTGYDIWGDYYATNSPKDWTVQGSIDAVTWDIIDTVANQTAWAVNEVRSFVCDVATTGYRYFRLVVTANNGGTQLGLGEWVLYCNSTDATIPKAVGSSMFIGVTQELTVAGPWNVATVSGSYPSQDDVRSGVRYGEGQTGDLELPAEVDVKVGVDYGAGGVEYEGAYAGGGGGNSCF